ncbi:hypothetical protein CKG00_18530 [Morganella morganii]|uniref:Uncharacterized protein n=1 Tax=Morganella morganii TaxID=582 RepID=A0A433ZPP4_MORMO|nr:hypothetical protein CKG00_18530 [Morganella morganii]
MIGHINGLANDLSILEQVELDHDHINFVAGLVSAGSGDICQSICRFSKLKTVKLNIFAYVFCQRRT